MKSKLTKEQRKVLRIRNPKPEGIHTVTIRYDDQCGNGHNSFSITAEGRDMGGCCHEEVVEAFPYLEKFIKWHLTSSDGPMHYIANTVYHAKEHGPDRGWLYADLPGKGMECIKYGTPDELEKLAEDYAGHDIKTEVRLDAKSAKKAELNHARSSAVWPEATDKQLTVSGDALTRKLKARLPKLMKKFREDMIELGFTY